MNAVKARLFYEKFRQVNNCKNCRGACPFGTVKIGEVIEKHYFIYSWKYLYELTNKTTMECTWKVRNELTARNSLMEVQNERS